MCVRKNERECEQSIKHFRETRDSGESADFSLAKTNFQSIGVYREKLTYETFERHLLSHSSVAREEEWSIGLLNFILKAIAFEGYLLEFNT